MLEVVDAHLLEVPARWRDRPVSRHGCKRIDGNTFALGTGLGFVRQWRNAVQCVFTYLDTHQAHDEPTSFLTGARQSLSFVNSNRVEYVPLDAMLTITTIENDQLVVSTVGSGRLYLFRKGDPQRVTAKEPTQAGLLNTAPTTYRVRLEPQDVILLANADAFDSQAIAALARTLGDPDQPATPEDLAKELSAPASRSGTGAAGVVFRVGTT